MYFTPKQLAILEAVTAYEKDHGYTPTLQELADRFEVSKITILEHVRALHKKGAITRDRYRSRSIELTRPGRNKLTQILAQRAKSGAPSAAAPVPARLRKVEPPGGRVVTLRLPLAGTIAAGQPIEAIQGQDEFDVADVLGRGKDCFVLRVKGDSMIEDHIQDGDFVIVERRDTADDGETVVALLEDGTATLKRLYRDGDRIRLQPANSALQPLIVDRVAIQGAVVGVLRKY